MYTCSRKPTKLYAIVHLLPALAPSTDSPQAMHAGVIRDMEQQKIKRERQLDFEMQKQLEEEYRKVQNVTDGDKR